MNTVTIKLACLVLLSVILAVVTANHSSFVISNLLSAQGDFFIALTAFLLSVSLFLFIHYLLLATSYGAKFYWIYYSLLIIAVASTLVVMEWMINVWVMLINVLILIATVLMVHLQFKREYSNMIKPHLGIASSSLTYIMFAIALLSTVNFYHIGTSGNSEDQYYEEFKTYILELVDTTTKTYMEKSSPQLNALGGNLIRSQAEGIFVKSIDKYAPYFMLVASLIVFVTMLSLSPIVRTLIWLYNALLLGLLVKTGLLKSRKVTIEAEKLSL